MSHPEAWNEDPESQKSDTDLKKSVHEQTWAKPPVNNSGRPGTFAWR